MAQTLTAADLNHWAFRQGRSSGMEGNKTRRALMAFGLACAADAQSRKNTKLWLAGFDSVSNDLRNKTTIASNHAKYGHKRAAY